MAETLHYRELGAAPRVLVLLHGLFGSAANWMGIARQLAPDWRVVVPDLRGYARADAVTELESLGLVVGVDISVPDAEVPAGMVTSTSPAAFWART